MDPGPWPSPDEIITAPATPHLPASAMICGIAGAGAVITIRSGTNGNDFKSGAVVAWSMAAYIGLTTAISPANPPFWMFRRTKAPIEERRRLPPTIAKPGALRSGRDQSWTLRRLKRNDRRILPQRRPLHRSHDVL